MASPSLEQAIAICQHLQFSEYSNHFLWRFSSSERITNFAIQVANDAATSLHRQIGDESVTPRSLPFCECLQHILCFWTTHDFRDIINSKLLSASEKHLEHLSKLLSSSSVRLSVTSSDRHSSSVLSMAFSHDRHHVASGSEDGSIRIWNVKTAECEHTSSLRAANGV
jgi:WD40 repeat protein